MAVNLSLSPGQALVEQRFKCALDAEIVLPATIQKAMHNSEAYGVAPVHVVEVMEGNGSRVAKFLIERRALGIATADNQLSILRASTLLRVVELSICDTSSGVVWNGRQSGGFRLADFPDLRSSKLAARSESDFFCVIGLVGVVRSRQASVGNPLVNCARRATTGFSYNRNANLFDDFAKTVRCHV